MLVSAMSSLESKSIEDICNWLRENADVPESVLDDFKGILFKNLIFLQT